MPDLTDKTYRVVELRLENFKRIKVADIRPDGAVVEITGANGEGKTSVLDGLWGAIVGGRSLPVKPIRTGAERASLRVDLGEIHIERRFKVAPDNPKGWTTDLTVTGADGAKFSSPQAVLDAIVGELTFDPLKFDDMSADEQFEALKVFVPGVKWEEDAAADKADYEARTVANREAKALRAQADAIVLPAGKLGEEVDLKALEDRLAEAGTHNAEVERRKGLQQQARGRIEEIDAEIERLTAEKTSLQKRLDEAAPIPDPIDTVEVQRQLAEGRATNGHRAAAARRHSLETQAAAQETESARLTKAMDDREKARQAAVRAARMPVEGLGFGPGYITLNGEPFSQASDAQRLAASIAIAANMNPRLRIVRVRDGSRFDPAAMERLRQYAEANDIQVWVERVDTSGQVGFVMEGGEVKGAAPSTPAPAPEEEAI